MERFKLSKWSIAAVLVLTAGVLLSCSFMADLVSSEPEVFWPMRSDDGYGLINCDGEWVVEPSSKFYNYSKMVDGLAPVIDWEVDENPAGIIDSEGNFIVEQEFFRAWPYSDGYALVEVDEEFRFVDQNGDYAFNDVFPVSYQIIPQFGNGMANVVDEYIDNGTGFIRIESMIYIDQNGDKVLGPYYFANPFSDGYAAVTLGKEDEFKSGFIDTNGDFVLEFDRESGLGPAGLYSEGLFPVADRLMQREENKCAIGFMDKNGDWEIEPQFCVVGRFVDGLAPAAKDMQDNFYLFGYIDKDGDWVIEPEYDMTTPNEFGSGCTLVFWNMYLNTALIDKDGDIIYSYSNE